MIDLEAYKDAIKKLNECESMVRHWKDEVRKVQLASSEQIRIRDEQLGERGGKIANLEQQLRVAQAKADECSTPRGHVEITHAEYKPLGQQGVGVTGQLRRLLLDERLTLNVPYNQIFYPDPFPGVPKELLIRYSHGLTDFAITVPEDTRITLPVPYGALGR